MRLIILFVCIAFAAGAFFLAVHFTSKPPEQAIPVVVESRPQAAAVAETKDVAVAKQDISIGTVIAPEMLDLLPWPKDQVQDDMIVVDPSHPVSSITKMIVRTPFQKGEPIYRSKLASENDPSFLASSLGEGMRLVTIPVDAISGAGGFVFPGDHVDVLVTHDVITGYMRVDMSNNSVGGGTGGGGGGGETSQPIKEPVTEVLISDVRVMAINQKSTAHGGDAPIVPGNISIEVSAADAQKIGFVENGNGHLSLALRSLKDKGTVTIPEPVESPNLTAVKTVTNPDASQVMVVRGTNIKTIGVTNP